MERFGVMNHLKVVICENAADAISKGFDYQDMVTAVEIDTVVVVREGTATGKSTVDLVLKDQAGNKFVVMVTGALLKSIPC